MDRQNFLRTSIAVHCFPAKRRILRVDTRAISNLTTSTHTHKKDDKKPRIRLRITNILSPFQSPNTSCVNFSPVVPKNAYPFHRNPRHHATNGQRGERPIPGAVEVPTLFPRSACRTSNYSIKETTTEYINNQKISGEQEQEQATNHHQLTTENLRSAWSTIFCSSVHSCPKHTRFIIE